jgi:hypothetical protein
MEGQRGDAACARAVWWLAWCHDWNALFSAQDAETQFSSAILGHRGCMARSVLDGLAVSRVLVFAEAVMRKRWIIPDYKNMGIALPTRYAKGIRKPRQTPIQHHICSFRSFRSTVDTLARRLVDSAPSLAYAETRS